MKADGLEIIYCDKDESIKLEKELEGFKDVDDKDLIIEDAFKKLHSLCKIKYSKSEDDIVRIMVIINKKNK